MRSVELDRYSIYLVAVALAGWALASYDVNLLVLALPAIAKDLNISQAGLGFLGLCVFGAQFCITLFAGYGMDTIGRRRMWMLCLAGSAIFTGLTYFVNEFWQLCLVRALATGFAYSEVAVSITIVSEQVPARKRGFLYSIVQGGWPLGVFPGVRCLPVLWAFRMALCFFAGRSSAGRCHAWARVHSRIRTFFSSARSAQCAPFRR